MEKQINIARIPRLEVLKVNIEMQEQNYKTATDDNYKSYLHRDIYRMKQEVKNILTNRKYQEN